MPSLNELEAAVTRLSKSDRGRDALERILNWLDNGGLALDDGNMVACSTILWAAWTNFAGTSRQLIRAALANPCDPGEVIIRCIREREDEGVGR